MGTSFRSLKSPPLLSSSVPSLPPPRQGKPVNVSRYLQPEPTVFRANLLEARRKGYFADIIIEGLFFFSFPAPSCFPLLISMWQPYFMLLI